MKKEKFVVLLSLFFVFSIFIFLLITGCPTETPPTSTTTTLSPLPEEYRGTYLVKSPLGLIPNPDKITLTATTMR